MSELTPEQAGTATTAILAALHGSRRPLGFVDLIGIASRACGVFLDTGQMMTLMSRLVVRRLVVRRPLDPQGLGRHDRMDVQLTDYHPAGRDAWVDEIPDTRVRSAG